MTIKIRDRYFKFDGVKYFRANAHNVQLCTYGRKRVPFGRTGELEESGRVAPRHLADERINVTRVSIDWDQVRTSDLGSVGNIRILGAGVNASHGFSLSRARSAAVELVGLSIGETALERVLNREANFVRREMEEEGRDARIVSEVWIAMEAELAEDFQTRTLSGGSVSYGTAGLEVSVGTSSRNRSEVTLAPGTTFAYRLHRVSDWNRRRTQIEDMAVDYPRQ